MAEDKPLPCSDCHKTFTWTSEEQDMFNRRGFTNEPKRCPGCRKNRRATRPGRPSRPLREMFSVPCAKCGREALVPFKPRGDRPVFCNDCFRA